MKLPDEQWPWVCYTSHPWPLVVEWCNNIIGEYDRDWFKLGEDKAAQSIMTDYKSTYLFRNEQHAVLFRLKWS
jgi:hypothetical protein